MEMPSSEVSLTVEQAYLDDNDQALKFLRPKFHEDKYPVKQILGYAGSLVLTFAAYLLVVNHVLPPAALLAVILTLAVIQGGLQLGVFMHVREGRGLAWQVIPLYLVILMGLGMVGMSIWIMLFKSGVS